MNDNADNKKLTLGQEIDRIGAANITAIDRAVAATLAMADDENGHNNPQFPMADNGPAVFRVSKKDGTSEIFVYSKAFLDAHGRTGCAS